MLQVPCFLAHHTVWCMVMDHLLRTPADRLPHNMYPDYDPGEPIPQQQILNLHDS
jgi:hypothetical protein